MTELLPYCEQFFCQCRWDGVKLMLLSVWLSALYGFAAYDCFASAFGVLTPSPTWVWKRERERVAVISSGCLLCVTCSKASKSTNLAKCLDYKKETYCVFPTHTSKTPSCFYKAKLHVLFSVDITIYSCQVNRENTTSPTDSLHQKIELPVSSTVLGYKTAGKHYRKIYPKTNLNYQGKLHQR